MAAFKTLWKDTVKTGLVHFRALWLCSPIDYQEDLFPGKRSNNNGLFIRVTKWLSQ